MATRISRERPDSEAAIALIEELEAELDPLYPSESRHGYSVDKLIREKVAFFILWRDDQPAGCGGIQLYQEYGELKRMYVRPDYRGRGYGERLLEHLAAYARQHGIECLRLETGIHQKAAIKLYERAGFRQIAPFGAYLEDPLSLFYERQ